MMICQIYRAYVYFFWRLSRWLQSDFDFSEKWGEWKASAAICILEGYVLLGVTFLLEYFFFGKGKLLPENPLPLFIVVTGILVALNHWLLNKKEAAEFKREFNEHSSRIHMLSGIAVAGLIFTVLFGMFVILYFGRER